MLVKKQPAAFHEFIEPMKIVLTDDPSARLAIKVDKTTVLHDLDDLLALVEAEKKTVTLPSIADDVRQMFREKLDATDGTGAKLKICRERLADPKRKTYFRMIAAMDFLAETLGGDALEDLVPYLGHDYWRLRDHSRKLAAGLVKTGGAETGAFLFAQTTDPATGRHSSRFLRSARTTPALELAKEAMKHAEPRVRKAATHHRLRPRW